MKKEAVGLHLVKTPALWTSALSFYFNDTFAAQVMADTRETSSRKLPTLPC